MTTVWTEHKAKDGRSYWYNSQTKKSRWDKPDEQESEWKEYTAPDGRKYWHNKTTKVSRWDSPTVSDPGQTTEQPQQISDYEKFVHMLSENGVGSDWTWERVVKSLYMKPNYKLLANALERREAFDKYRMQLIQDQERQKEEELRLRQEFDHTMSEMLDAGMLTIKSKWTDLSDTISGTQVLFDSYMSKLEQRVYNDGQVIQKSLNGFRVGPSTQYEDYLEHISKVDVHQYSKKLHFDILQQVAQDKKLKRQVTQQEDDVVKRLKLEYHDSEEDGELTD